MNALARLPRPKPHYITPSKVAGYVAIARKCGIDVAGFEVRPDGTIRIVDARAVAQPVTDFDRWEGEL